MYLAFKYKGLGHALFFIFKHSLYPLDVHMITQSACWYLFDNQVYISLSSMRQCFLAFTKVIWRMSVLTLCPIRSLSSPAKSAASVLTSSVYEIKILTPVKNKMEVTFNIGVYGYGYGV